MLQNATYFEELQNYSNKYRSYEERTPVDIYEELIQKCNYIGKQGKEIIHKAYLLAEK